MYHHESMDPWAHEFEVLEQFVQIYVDNFTYLRIFTPSIEFSIGFYSF